MNLQQSQIFCLKGNNVLHFKLHSCLGEGSCNNVFKMPMSPSYYTTFHKSFGRGLRTAMCTKTVVGLSRADLYRHVVYNKSVYVSFEFY